MPGGLGERLRERSCGWGSCVVELEHTDSTNALGFTLARAGAPEGCLIRAQRQGQGRGRWHRRWASSPGGAYVSIVLRPNGRASSPSLLPLLVSVATAEALSARTGLAVRLRWPNDVYVEGRKIAGILCESSFDGSQVDFVVAGIGVNVNQTARDFPAEVAARATSIRLLRGVDPDPTALVVDIIDRVKRQYDEDDASRVLERCRALVEGATGARVRFTTREAQVTEAVTVGIEDDGGLRVTLDDGSSRVLYAEEVHLLKED